MVAFCHLIASLLRSRAILAMTSDDIYMYSCSYNVGLHGKNYVVSTQISRSVECYI